MTRLREDAFDITRGILGGSFISPVEVKICTGLDYSGSQIAALRALMPPVQELVRMKNERAMLVALPPEPLSMSELRGRNPRLFASGQNGWGSSHRFSQKEWTPFGWLEIQRTCSNHVGRLKMPMSARQMNAVTAAWFVATTCLEAIPDMELTGYMLTSSMCDNNSHIYVAPHPERGQICLCNDGLRKEVLVRWHQFYTPS